MGVVIRVKDSEEMPIANATEYIINKLDTSQDEGVLFMHETVENTASVMIEFAKIHVERALQAANKNAKAKEGGGAFGDLPYLYVESESILKSYPVENIK